MDLISTAQLLGNFGEFFGAIAVVATLGYLTIQIRHQNREAHAAAMHEVLTGFRDSVSSLGDQKIAEVYTKAASLQELSDAEHMQLMVHIQRILRVYEEAYMQKQQGRLDDAVWEGMLLQINYAMSGRPFRLVWELRKGVYSSAFRHFIDGLPVKEYGIREVAEPDH